MLRWLLIALLLGPAIGGDMHLHAQKVQARMLDEKTFHLFPSASTILFFGDKLYVIGDDSRYVLILDRKYSISDSLRLFDSPLNRVAKPVKADIESAVALGSSGRRMLLLGSGSAPLRRKAYLVSMRRSESKVVELPVTSLFDSVSSVVSQVNIEGAVLLGNKLILGNRKTPREKSNFLLVSDKNSIVKNRPRRIRGIELGLPDSVRHAGISELCYVGQLDLMLITLSTEDVANSYDDGKIGNSYIAWISSFGKKVSESSVAVDGILDLAAVHPHLRSQKVEGICVEKILNKKMILDLVSDNDDGRSRIFKLEVSFPY